MENSNIKSTNEILNEIELEQKKASNPNNSIWVNANAGTGKTKVLVDRILRILLNGESHSKILCITYTKAATSEINQRVLNILSKWSYIDDDLLTKELTKIGIEKINVNILKRAKSLCNIIIDSNIPLKIFTIHGFCQDLLNKYHLEANISNNFTVLDKNSNKYSEIKTEVYNEVLLHILEQDDIDLKTILNHYNDATLEHLIDKIIYYSIELIHLQNLHKDNKQLKEVIFKHFKTSPELDYNECLLQNCKNEAFDYTGFLNLYELLNNNYNNLSSNDVKTLKSITEWLFLDPQKRAETFYTLWNNVFFTTKYTIRKNIFTQKTLKFLNNNYLQELLNNEISRLEILQEKLANIKLANSNYELLKLAIVANKIYTKLKKEANFLDYSDLLQITKKLLSDMALNTSFHYNLNQNISHILIDESQDTSPIQWEILKYIIKELFSTPGENKSIFIVGDLKQSIYSFQGAKPENLVNVKEFIKDILTRNKYTWKEINLNASFRSSKAVLALVNEVSSNLFNSNMYQAKEIYHKCVNPNMEGKVEIWPTISLIKNENTDTTKDDIYKKQAEAITEKIIYLINNKLYQPKDIMILYKNRVNNKVVNHIVKILEDNHIKNSGLDKISLNNHLGILDILSIGKFILQPLYNLNLANLLKSPVFNFSDEELTSLIKEHQTKFLWEILESSNNPKLVYTLNKLQLWIQYFHESRSLTEFFTKILYKDNLYNTYLKVFGAEIKELFNELLNLVIKFEKNSSISTLEHFIHFFETTVPQLTKEKDTNANEVKLFTIHGSKGLEANVVFLLDKPHNVKNEKLILTNIPELPLIFKLNKNIEYNSKLQESFCNNTYISAEEEQKRLLYVAITRAKKILYISSINGTKKDDASNNTFYQYIENSIKNYIKEEQTFFDQEKFGFTEKFAVVYK